LRQLEKRFDDQIKAIVQLLADTRRELKAARFTDFPKDTRPVQFDELLRFAKNISKFTVHPSAAFPQKPRIAEGVDGSGLEQIGSRNTPAAVEASKGALSTTQGTPAPTQGTGGINGQTEKESGDVGIGWESLTDQQKAWLDQFARAPFVPWPSEERIRAGALSSIQVQMEQGQDIGQPEQAPAVTSVQPTQVDVDMEDDVEHGNGVPLPVPPATIEKPRAPREEFTGFDF
jgi:hypothetical protein